MSFLTAYGPAILFYIAIVLLIYFNRRKFEIQGIVAMYRSTFGIKWMDSFAKRHGKFLRCIGYLGIIVGFIGMAFILVSIVYGIIIILTVPGAPPVVSPIIPGFKIAGTDIVIPLVQGLIALFITIAIHEFSHGILSRAYNIPVRKTGFVMFGPFPGAFVEPDEKKTEKASRVARASIVSAGPFANVILAVIVVLIGFFIIAPIGNSMITTTGIYFSDVNETSPAGLAGLPENITFNSFDGQDITTIAEFRTLIDGKQPGETLLIANDNMSVPIILGEHPVDYSLPYLGVNLDQDFVYAPGSSETGYKIFLWFVKLFDWLFIFNIALGLTNLLPFYPLDGGRLLKEGLNKKIKEKPLMKFLKYMSVAGWAVILILLLYTLFGGLF